LLFKNGDIVKRPSRFLLCALVLLPLSAHAGSKLVSQKAQGAEPAPRGREQAKPTAKQGGIKTSVEGEAPQVDPAKAAAIRKLFEVQGMTTNFERMLVSMTDNIRPMLSNSLPPGEYRSKLLDLFFQKFQTKFKIEQMIEFTIPIYDKHLSKEDIDGLIHFYQTPLGHKLISVMPDVTMESQAMAMQQGQQIGQESMMEVLQENPTIKKAMEEAAAAPRN
jgi:uncharacterized protein